MKPGKVMSADEYELWCLLRKTGIRKKAGAHYTALRLTEENTILAEKTAKGLVLYMPRKKLQKR